MASGASFLRWPPAGLSVRPYYRREERIHVEQDEVLVVPDPDRAYQPGIDSRQVGTRRHGVFGHLEKVDHLPYAQSIAAAGHLHNHDRALVRHFPPLLEEDVAVENGE